MTKPTLAPPSGPAARSNGTEATSPRRRATTLLMLAPLVLGMLAGCTNVFKGPEPPEGYQTLGFRGTDTTGENPSGWPRLDGVQLTILDHGAFGGFDNAKKAFERLTGATVTHIAANDAGSALNRAIQGRGNPDADVIYGLDNALLYSAVKNETLEPYKPVLADRIDPSFIFFNASANWYATPVDHGFISINVDHSNPDNAGFDHKPVLNNVTIKTFTDVAAHAGQFVTENPRTSSPGLGFLLATIKKFGEDPNGYPWQAYWRDLLNGQTFGNCAVGCTKTGQVLVTQGWNEAYAEHFSGGYGAKRYGGTGAADRAIVTSYTESPAYEAFFGHANKTKELPEAMWRDPNTSWHQIQTMGILRGTKHLAAAQAWVEFTLTDAFQKTRASDDAVYPVVSSISVTDTYNGLDPDPASIPYAQMDWKVVGVNLPRWLADWTKLCQEAKPAQQC